MNYQSAGFADELIKLAVVGKALGKVLSAPAKWAVKNPMSALGVGFTVAPPIMAARQAYKDTMEGGQGSGYLSAGKDESGRVRSSESAHVNWHGLLPHKPTSKQVKALSKNYDESMF